MRDMKSEKLSWSICGRVAAFRKWVAVFKYSSEYLHHLACWRTLFPVSSALPLRILTMSSSGCSNLLSSNGSLSCRGSAPMRSTQPSHPYLSSDQASTIASWTSSISNRNPGPRTLNNDEAAQREAAFEAYRQLKLAMFSKSTGQS
jgi:hypothetical protein